MYTHGMYCHSNHKTHLSLWQDILHTHITLLSLDLAPGNPSDYAKPSYSHSSPFPRIRPVAVVTSAGRFLVVLDFNIPIKRRVYDPLKL